MICVFGPMGVLDHERRDGQWFRVDLALHLDVSQAALADSLEATADYSQAAGLAGR